MWSALKNCNSTLGRALGGLLGNDALKRDLSAALRAGRLAHSVLLCGEQGMGAGFAARCLAADFLYPEGGAPAAAVLEGRSPEVLALEGEGASGLIKIDAVRAVRRAVYDTALSAAGRAVLVYGAEKLNAASANAMLKVIEEPPENVLFVFTAVSEAAVLPTSAAGAVYIRWRRWPCPNVQLPWNGWAQSRSRRTGLQKYSAGGWAKRRHALPMKSAPMRWQGRSASFWRVKKKMHTRPSACLPRMKKTVRAPKRHFTLFAMCAPLRWQNGQAAQFPRSAPRIVRRAQAKPYVCWTQTPTRNLC